mgnify:CR=1 FL=1
MHNLFSIFFTMTTALTSLGYSMLINAKLVELTGQGLRAQSIALSAFLIGLAFGGFYYSRQNFQKEKKLINTLFVTEALVTLIGTSSLFIIALLTTLYILFINPLSIAPSFISPIVTYSITIPILFMLGAVSGIQLPAILKIFSKEENKVLFLNYTGALIAGPLINYFLDLSIKDSIQVSLFFIFNIINLLILLFYSRVRFKFVYLSTALLLSVVSIKQLDFVQSLQRSVYYMGHSLSETKNIDDFFNLVKKYGKIEHYQTQYQKIDLVTESAIQQTHFDGDFTLYLNRRPQLSTHTIDVYHQSMAEGSFNLNKKIPSTVLILGGGDGLLINNLKNYKQIKRITQVELDSKVLELAKYHPTLSYLNKDTYASQDPRVTVLIDDAINYLRNTKDKFEAIFIDFPFPYNPELLKLFSYEFYSLVEHAVADKGYIVLDFPVFPKESSKQHLSPKILNSVLKAGFNSYFIYGLTQPFLFAKKGIHQIKFEYQSLPISISLGALQNFMDISYLFKEKQTDDYISIFQPERI